MNAYHRTKRVAVIGCGLLALIALFVAVVRLLDVAIAGVQPEAWALTAMMTAPLTVGIVVLGTLGTAAVETVLRHRRT